MMANRLIYVCYGRGGFVDESRFSVLSAIRHDGPRPDGYQVTVVTDDGEPFDDLGVAVEVVPAEQWAAWIGPANYTYRIKIGVLRDALARPGCRAIVMVDSDTYFRRSPAALFERVGPGRAVMHVREGAVGRLVGLGEVRHRVVGTAYDLATPGGPYAVTADTPMWNSGVLGISAADAPLVDEAAALTDAVFAETGLRVAEQFAFGCVLGRRATVAEGRDVVFHYYPADLRKPFRAALPRLLGETAGTDPAARAAALYRHRPIPTVAKRAKAAVKRPLKRLGLFAHDQETSV